MRRQRSLVMRPHANDLYGTDFGEDLIHQAMLDVDPAGARPSKIADELFIPGRSLKRVSLQDFEEIFGLSFQAGGGEFLGVLLGLFRENDGPRHQGSSVEVLLIGVLSPRIMDSRIFGMESRYNVS